jgi:hypothetical protein
MIFKKGLMRVVGNWEEMVVCLFFVGSGQRAEEDNKK